MSIHSQNGSLKPLHVAYLGPEATFSHQAAIDAFERSSENNLEPILHPLPSFKAIFSAVQNSISPTVSPSSSKHPTSATNSISQPEDPSPDKKTDKPPAIDYAVIPVENSTNGSVVQVLDLLAQCGLTEDAKYPDIEVVGEYYLSVHHCLYVTKESISTPRPTNSSSISETLHSVNNSTLLINNTTKNDIQNHSPSSLDLENISRIKTLYTHPQVWGQCTSFLNSYLTNTEKIDMSSTSAAARFVARLPTQTPLPLSPAPNTHTITTTTIDADSDNDGISAAISSKLAGQLNKMTLLAENIEDDSDGNTTRFFIIRNRNRNRNLTQPRTQNGISKEEITTTTSLTPSSSTTENHLPSTSTIDPTKTEIKYKSLITFTVPHHLPGSLANALAVFGKHGFNLRTINTRPTPPPPTSTPSSQGVDSGTTASSNFTKRTKNITEKKTKQWQYVFFVECEETRSVDGHGHGHGHDYNYEYDNHIENENEQDGRGGQAGKLQVMLHDLEACCERIRCLGSWVDRLPT